jgi:DNA-binding IclR family transcriptional regulator
MRTIGSVEKGLRILEVIADMPEGARVKDVSEGMEIPTSNMTLFLNALTRTGYVTKDTQTGRYFLSQKLGELAAKAEHTKYHQLRRRARPVMIELHQQLDENVLLAVLSGHDVQFIDRFQSNRSVQILHNPEVSYPPHVTAAGKAILAYLAASLRDAYLSSALYHRFTNKSLVKEQDLRAELEKVRTDGFAINRGEYESEVMAIAAPISDNDTVVASLVVQFPRFRYAESDLAGFAQRVREAADQISARIGTA